MDFGRELEYNCKILEKREGDLKIYTEDGDCLWFGKGDIIYAKEIKSFEGEAVIRVGKRKRVPWWKLKVEKGPLE
ncbi:hypothetical protein HOD29_01865 [archaeon]|nr:hypothetical protein [archaeon]